MQFQSTRPHGARLGHELGFNTSVEFQSTRPHGARHKDGNVHWFGEKVSIHAPTWGATNVTG